MLVHSPSPRPAKTIYVAHNAVDVDTLMDIRRPVPAAHAISSTSIMGSYRSEDKLDNNKSHVIGRDVTHILSSHCSEDSCQKSGKCLRYGHGKKSNATLDG